MIQKLKFLLTKRDKQFLIGLIFFSIVVSFIEMLGISLIMPFIAVATDFELIHTNKYYSFVYTFFSFSTELKFVIIFGVSLIFFYFFRSVVNLLYFYLLSKFTQGRYHLLAYRLFEKYMGMSYKNFIGLNSSTITKSIVTEAHNLTQLLSSLLFMMSEVFMVIFIYALMLYVNYKITLLLSIILILNVWLMLKVVSVKIKDAGIVRADTQKTFYEIINRSLSNFKLIKLQANNEDLLSTFGDTSFSYANANITNATLGHVPRLFFEAIGFGLIVLIITYLVWKYENDISMVLSLVSMFVLALYRLMPSVNRIMSSYNLILFYYKSLDIIHDDLMHEVEKLGSEKIIFNKNIVLEDIGFEYEQDKPILKNINLIINKGDKIAFIGESGSGKSTLIDIIVGLHYPQKGRMYSDEALISSENLRSWRNKVGYIPQSVYLFDGTVGENVAFGLEYNNERIDTCLKQAKIYDFLVQKEGKETLVGEGGIMLSGGQKQRVAIARALYGNPDILVLDEATSALDDETEQQIMDEIYDISENKTLIIIAHRLSTLDKCEKIYTLKEGRLI